MAKTIIDQLVVSLDLDPKKFKEGEKQAVDALRDLEKQGKKTGDAVSQSADKGSSSLAALGKRVAVVATIFKVLSYTTRNILEASRATYDLSNAARHLGESSRMLRNFENVAEIMGGTAEGARKSIQGLKQALFDVKFQGQWSQQLTQISRLGVNVVGSGGKPRDFKDVYLDTAASLQNNIASGKMTESEALMFAESAGFDPGLARSMVGGRDAAALALARQEARRQITDEDTRGAAATEQAIISAGQAKDTAFTAAGTAGGFADAQRVAGALEGAWTNGATGEIGAAWESLIGPVTTGLGDLADATKAAAANLWGMARTAALGKGPEAYRGAVMDSARKHGLDPALLAGVIGAESNWDPNAKSGAGAVGIAQFMPATAAGFGFTAGVNPVEDIDQAARYLASLKRSFMAEGQSESDATHAALMSYNAGPGRYRASSWYDGSGAELSQETLDYPGRVYGAAERWRGGGMAAGDTKIDIGEVNVITAATDANGMATGASDALRRKLTAAQAPSQGPQ